MHRESIARARGVDRACIRHRVDATPRSTSRRLPICPAVSVAGHAPHVDDQRLGAVIRAIRHRRSLRQEDLAAAAGVSQSYVSFLERGHVGRLTVQAVRSIAAAMDVEIVLEPRWRGAELDRLVDAAHSALVERTVRVLRDLGWQTSLEFGFNHFGERGSVDVLAWHPTERALLIIEVKTRIGDAQRLFASFARKVRIVPRAAHAERGWNPRVIGRVLVLPGTTANRSLVERLRTSFDATFPLRARAVRSWLGCPVAPMAGVWFVPPTSVEDRARTGHGRCRVRRRRQGDGAADGAPAGEAAQRGSSRMRSPTAVPEVSSTPTGSSSTP